MTPNLNDTDHYILDTVRKWVWSGFSDAEDVNAMIDDILEEDAHEDLIRAAVLTEFERKLEAEKLWLDITDCDRLDAVFGALDRGGILCLQNSGFEMSDGHQEAYEILSDQPNHKYMGYCFYHGQDLERAVDGGGLMLAFNEVEGGPDKLAVAHLIREELKRAGFQVEWDGTAQHRINLPAIDWKRRYKNGR